MSANTAARPTFANLARAMRDARDAGIWVVGLDGAAPRSLYSVALTVPLMLVLGSEGAGLRRLTRERCDLLVRLPMHGPVESLNAAVAGSIALYETVRQREETHRTDCIDEQ